MSSENGLSVYTRGLSKKYKVYASPFRRVKEALTFGRRIFHKEVWALQDVNIELQPGKALGVIGSNGAGKSTLLKILSGTTLATSGTFKTRGKVASLLELGTGFHTEFTGRDNIFLNASVMGFSKKEIEGKLDSIIEFTELGHFIDQPVRTYSSGMIMRLGFSVATAIDPDVLIIDEILAVGDLHFQKKCIDRIFGFREKGKSIIFCSHSMYHVRQICDEVIWVKDGRIEKCGDPQEVTAEYANYERSLNSQANDPTTGVEMSDEKDPPQIDEVLVLDENGESVSVVQTGQSLTVQLDYSVPQSWNSKLNCGFAVWTSDSMLISFASSGHEGIEVPSEPGNSYRVRIGVPNLPLVDGEFSVIGYLYDEKCLHGYDQRMVDRPLVVKPQGGASGLVALGHNWHFEDR